MWQILALIVLDYHREAVVRAAGPLAAGSQLGLSVVIFFGTSLARDGVLTWVVASLLVVSALFALTQTHRTRDRVNFVLVLLDMASDVLGKFPSIFALVAAVVTLQIVYLLWWGTTFVAALGSVSGAVGVLWISLLLLNLYWTANTIRLVVVVVAVGSVSHWFALFGTHNEHSLGPRATSAAGTGGGGEHGGTPGDGGETGEASEEEAASPRQSTPQASPLLFDGSLIPATLELGPQVPPKRTTATSMIPPPSSDGGGMELTDGEAHRVVAHLCRVGCTTSLGTVCRGALCCLPVRAAEVVIAAVAAWPWLEPYLCVDLADGTVRAYHELLFTHVAAYSKSFNAAARDVWRLIDDSGLEVVQEDDVASAVIRSACLGLAAAVACALLGLAQVTTATSPAGGSDLSWVWVSAVALGLAYLGCGLPLQVLDSAVTAIYVVFAEHPSSLEAHFPIVHHRFARIAEFSLYDFDRR